MAFEQQPEALRNKVRSLATESVQNSDSTGWFETLYLEAKGDVSQVPWARSTLHPYLQDWLEKYPPQTEGKSAVVIGCGLGDDAEALANLGFKVTAFDISPTAIEWCQQRFPNSAVIYTVADLFELDSACQKSFDFVVESRTIQALPLKIRSETVKAIASLVAKNGTLLVVTRVRESDGEPDGPPWPLSERELSQFQEFGLQEIRRDSFFDSENSVTQLRIEYRF